MSTHYFSRVRLERDRVPLGALAELFASGHPGHTLAWKFFGDHASRERDFIFRTEQSDEAITLYTVSSREPEPWEDYADLISKPYAPVLEPEMLFEFRLLVNPNVSAPAREQGKRGKKVDAIMHAKHILYNDEARPIWLAQAFDGLQEEGIIDANASNRSDMIRDHDAFVQACGVAWLQKRGTSAGFQVSNQHTTVTGYGQQRFAKRPRSKKTVQFSSFEASGVLQVTDPAIFLNTLYNGIGSAKAYGNGLMMIKPL